MLFNAHNFCGMANHFSMLGLGKSGKITKKCGQHFLQILLQELRNKGAMRRSLSLSQWVHMPIIV